MHARWLARLPSRTLLMAYLGVGIAACATDNTGGARIEPSKFVEKRDNHLAARVTGVRPIGDGWIEFKVELANLASKPLTNVAGAVRGPEAQYFTSDAGSINVHARPKLAGQMAMQSGIAVGTTAVSVLTMVPFLGALAAIGMSVNSAHQLDQQMDVMEYTKNYNLQSTTVFINETKSGSFFFPAVAIDQLRIQYVIDGAKYQITLDDKDTGKPPEPVSAAPMLDLSTPQARITAVQKLLLKRGYNPGPADGQMGPNTRQAIRQFQRNSGLPQTGQIDDKLIEKLQ